MNEMYPTQSVVVPSKNRFYGLDETFKFEIRGMTVQEQKQLLNMNQNNVDDTIMKIIRACVTNIDVNQLNLLLMDRDYLLYEIRKLTYGNDINIEYSCSNCGTKNSFVQDLSTLEVKYIDDDSILERLKYKSKYIINEETGEPVVIQFFFPTVKSNNEMNILMKNKNNKDLLIYQTIVSNIYSIDGEPVNLLMKKELMEIFMGLPASEITEMTKLLRHDFGIQQTVKHICDNCSTENDVPVLNTDFFFPVR